MAQVAAIQLGHYRPQDQLRLDSRSPLPVHPAVVSQQTLAPPASENCASADGVAGHHDEHLEDVPVVVNLLSLPMESVNVRSRSRARQMYVTPNSSRLATFRHVQSRATGPMACWARCRVQANLRLRRRSNPHIKHIQRLRVGHSLIGLHTTNDLHPATPAGCCSTPRFGAGTDHDHAHPPPPEYP